MAVSIERAARIKPYLVGRIEQVTRASVGPWVAVVVRDDDEEALDASMVDAQGGVRLRNEIRWAQRSHTRTREYAVMTLFPRILYTFSDMVVFVLREVR